MNMRKVFWGMVIILLLCLVATSIEVVPDVTVDMDGKALRKVKQIQWVIGAHYCLTGEYATDSDAVAEFASHSLGMADFSLEDPLLGRFSVSNLGSGAYNIACRGNGSEGKVFNYDVDDFWAPCVVSIDAVDKEGLVCSIRAIAHLGDRKDAVSRPARHVLAKAASDIHQPYAGAALWMLAEGNGFAYLRRSELKQLTLALCNAVTNNAACGAAIRLAGERGYVEVLPIVRRILSDERRDAVVDVACIGALGLLGNVDDIALIYRFEDNPRCTIAANAAIRQIRLRLKVSDPSV